jgi:hypothetical protein
MQILQLSKSWPISADTPDRSAIAVKSRFKCAQQIWRWCKGKGL